MTTEEKAREYLKQELIQINKRFNKPKEYSEQSLIEFAVLFHNSQPPNLICGGGGQVIDSDYVESLIFEITQLTKENQELKTSLQQEKSRWVRTKGILIDTELKLKAVTKENQELKMLIHGLAKKDIENNKLLEISFTKLQAAEDRIKE
jgi:hypothetical protein